MSQRKLVDWKKPIHCVHIKSGTIFPIKFSHQAKNHQDKFETTGNPNNSLTNNLWHADGSDWCMHNEYYVENVPEPEPSMVPANCMNCKWWEKFMTYRGLCRRRAPVIMGEVRYVTNARFPETGPACWCGDYEEKRSE